MEFHFKADESNLFSFFTHTATTEVDVNATKYAFSNKMLTLFIYEIKMKSLQLDRFEMQHSNFHLNDYFLSAL
jgi:hypothetical protein